MPTKGLAMSSFNWWWLFRRARMRRPARQATAQRIAGPLHVEVLEDRTSPAVSPNPLSWSALGPAPILLGQTPGSEPVSGRITGIAADPGDANNMYVSTAGGGVWHLADSGTKWVALTDNLRDAAGNPLPMFMGAIALAPRANQ